MPVTKTEVVSVRVPPVVKAALVEAADQERRSLATIVEGMVLDYCKTHGITAAPVRTGKPDRRKPAQAAGQEAVPTNCRQDTTSA